MEIIRFVIDFLSFYTIYLMLSISLNLEYGYAGISNFGKVMFFAGGAFTVGALATRLTILLTHGRWIGIEEFINSDVILGSNVSLFFAKNPLFGVFMFLFLLVLAMAVSAILGYIASYPAIRLREDYLGMTLIVSGELLRNIAKNYEPLVCGTFGVYVPNPFSWVSGLYRDLFLLSLLLAFSGGTWIVMEYLLNSPFGRVLKAMRESEDVVESYGRDIVKLRIKTLMLGSAIAGLAGGLYAFYTGSVHPDDFTTTRTFLVWVIVIIGGVGNNLGAAVGAFFYVLIDRLIAYYKHSVYLPFDVNYMSYIILSIILILVIFYSPQGIFPEKPTRTPVIEKLRERQKEKIKVRASST
ncbi:MAG: branched-chain amino acid ABC transporter permease [Thermofilum sp. ex4484_79]|nr:MAG: branched-chain amino acid ABC transporter permease [Thermofilum sp. ex4484_79]